ncbi:malonyl CoA-acyl carrier protein transacylase [Mycobacterium xenopi 3993]|nr:malonyl CoA-acyl carrier protein transacylase [Mycobacterium xenopi 3993]
MLSPWLELPGAAEQIAAWSAASGLDLARLGTTASAEEITDTAVTQPLVVAATLLAYRELVRRGAFADAELLVAGHSVGEIAAYAIAGVISADDAVSLAATRVPRWPKRVRSSRPGCPRCSAATKLRCSPTSSSSIWSRPTATARVRSSQRAG